MTTWSPAPDARVAELADAPDLGFLAAMVPNGAQRADLRKRTPVVVSRVPERPLSGHGGTTLAPRGTFNRKEIDLTVVVGNLGLPLWRRTQVIQPVPFGSALEGLRGGREETGKVSIDEPRDVGVGARARSR